MKARPLGKGQLRKFARIEQQPGRREILVAHRGQGLNLGGKGRPESIEVAREGGTADRLDETGQGREIVRHALRTGDGLGEFLEAELLVDEGARFLEHGQGRNHHFRRSADGIGMRSKIDDRDLAELRLAQTGRRKVFANA